MAEVQTGGRGASHRMRNAAWVLLAVLLVLMGSALAYGAYNGAVLYPGGMMYTFHGWWFFPFGFILVFFVFFGFGRLFFWPWGWGRRWGYWHSDEALEILRQRYARGEITREQFEQMSRDLEQKR